VTIVRLVLACLVWIAALAGCGSPWSNDGNQWDADSGGAPTTSAGTGGASTTSAGGTGGGLLTGGSGGTACAQGCVLGKIAPFAGLSAFYTGPPEDAPPCPGVVGFKGYYEIDWKPLTCSSCSCSAACTLTETMHASAASCDDSNAAASTPFDAPPGWDGTCTEHDAIAEGLQCAGVACVQSLTIAPAVNPCESQMQGDMIAPPPSWGKLAQECFLSEPTGEGCDPGFVCPPALPKGYSLCLYLANDPERGCDTEDYPRKIVAYDKTPKDERTCSSCTCGDPEGAGCEALVSVFKDQACGTLLGSYTVTSAMDDGCHDLPAGVALGSKSAV
jgi:hypothetical protein